MSEQLSKLHVNGKGDNKIRTIIVIMITRNTRGQFYGLKVVSLNVLIILQILKLSDMLETLLMMSC